MRAKVFNESKEKEKRYKADEHEGNKLEMQYN
jgi:hypothetical protein